MRHHICFNNNLPGVWHSRASALPQYHPRQRHRVTAVTVIANRRHCRHHQSVTVSADTWTSSSSSPSLALPSS
eukprot:8798502-Pyramimonas_sp.AAC.1